TSSSSALSSMFLSLDSWRPVTACGPYAACGECEAGRAVSVPIALGLLALIGTVRWTLSGEPGDRSRAIALSVLTWYVLPGTLALLAHARVESSLSGCGMWETP